MADDRIEREQAQLDAWLNRIAAKKEIWEKRIAAMKPKKPKPAPRRARS